MKQFKKSSKVLSTLLACTIILSSVQFSSIPVQAAEDTIKIDKSKTNQEIWGFGAAANNPVNDLMVGQYSTATKNEIFDKLFSTTGDLSTGFNITRWRLIHI